jgi:hypothetical protein
MIPAHAAKALEKIFVDHLLTTSGAFWFCRSETVTGKSPTFYPLCSLPSECPLDGSERIVTASGNVFWTWGLTLPEVTSCAISASSLPFASAV